MCIVVVRVYRRRTDERTKNKKRERKISISRRHVAFLNAIIFFSLVSDCKSRQSGVATDYRLGSFFHVHDGKFRRRHGAIRFMQLVD